MSGSAYAPAIRSAKEDAALRLAALSPALRYTGDEPFEQWQKRARAKLNELLGMDKFVPCAPNVRIEYEKPFGDAKETRFTFESEKGWGVPCHLLTPPGAPKGVMICLQGHSTGMHNSLGRALYEGDEDALDGDRDFASQAVKRGYIAVALEQRAFGECGGTPRPDCYGAAMMCLMAGRTLLGERVWDVQRLIETLKTEFGFAGLPFYCMGNSGGGTATFYAACVTEAIAGAIPSCSVCAWDRSIGYTYHCACNYVPHIAEYFDMGEMAGLIAPRVYVQVNGKDDDIFLPDGAQRAFDEAKRLYAAAGAPEKCRLVVGDGGHRFYAQQAWEAFEMMKDERLTIKD